MGLRYAPPRTVAPEAVDWLFLRSLGRPGAPWTGGAPVALEQLDGFRGATELLPRIWSRTDRELIESELDVSDGRQIQLDYHHSVAVEIQAQETCKLLAEKASERGMPLIFLKGLALQLAGYVEVGVRQAADIDVLVPQGDAAPFQRCLMDEGSVIRGLPASDQHLPVLEHPSGALVEVHHQIRGVSLNQRSTVRADVLLEEKLCEELAGWPDGIFVPKRTLLLAHLLVHALGQHTFSPAAYPQAQLLADLQDLGVAEETTKATVEDAVPWIEHAVSRQEIEAVCELVSRLSAGELATSLAALSGPPGLMMRHLLAGAVDPEYRQALKVEGALHLTTGQSESHSALRTLKKALFLTRGQIDIIYGRPKRPLGYLGRRLWRPFDLMARTLRSGMVWIRMRQR